MNNNTYGQMPCSCSLCSAEGQLGVINLRDTWLLACNRDMSAVCAGAATSGFRYTRHIVTKKGIVINV